MELQGRNLSLNMRPPHGDDVALLHRELGQLIEAGKLDARIEQREIARKTFGPTTERTVVLFQRKHRLPATAEVDERTASLINREVDRLPKAFVVKGRVVTHQHFGLRDVRVVAVDKNVGDDKELGNSTTGAKGGYEIQYEFAPLRERGKEKPDIQVKVTTADDRSKLMASSDVHYDAESEETIDVVIPADQLVRPPEYQRLSTDMIKHLGRQELGPDADERKGRFARLQENEERQDITYLANKTGWDARLVAMVALADQFAEQSRIRQEFCYALFRAGLPANEAVLSQINPETVEMLWNKAVDEQILPEEMKEEIPENLERFKTYGTDRLLETSAKVGVSSLKEMVGISLGNDEERIQRFAQVYYENRREPADLWGNVRREFGDEVADRLELDGKLGFLTVNNAGLIKRLHRDNELRSPLDLVRAGLYRRDAWEELLTEDMPVPEDIPGKEAEEKKANYIDFMVNQLKLAYPTAVVAEMVRNDEIALEVNDGDKRAVLQFLDDQQGRFELGVHPVEQYIQKHDVVLADEALTQIKRLQRVYQISPNDEVMGKLVKHKIDSAYAVVQYDEREFVEKFKDEMGGKAAARLTYGKAHQVHNVVLNVATAYIASRSLPSPYAMPPALKPHTAEPPEDTGVIAYPTLESLFGEMDYCACEHCRSWLSPAAYLVDLLKFIDPPTYETRNPLDVLIERRPDIQHLQLTCENTNTVLPYIDLVNEILEHFVVNNSLETFEGHNIEAGISTEELLANPQFVNDTAYNGSKDGTIKGLKQEVFPLALPFHQPLEASRQYFNKFEAPLHVAMEQLRKNDSLDVSDGAKATDYAWRDILLERLQISRQEYAVLTDHEIPLQELYGEDSNTVTEAELINQLSNVKGFARRLGIGYEELIEITRTQFINPCSHLIPKVEKLGVNFADIKDFNDGTLDDANFDDKLSDDLDPAQYGGDVKQWVRDNYEKIMGLIVLSDPTGSEDVCSFETLEFRYALPDFENNRLKASEFLKLVRFIRLWEKLGWTIEYTDKAVAALYPPSHRSGPADDEAEVKNKLDEGFKELILRIAHVKGVMDKLNLRPKRELLKLLACWSDIDTHGSRSLCRQMFLNPTILKLDDVFQEDGYGNYLHDANQKVVAHTEALRAAFNLTQGDFDLILQELGFDEDTALNLANVSAIFRHGYLARKLRLSVQEFLALKAMSGLDPFLPLDLAQPSDPHQPLGAVRPPAIRFIDLAQQIKASPLKVSQLLYFLQHVDLSSKASPTQESVLAFARTLRNDLLRIDREHVVQEDPSGEIARAKMALVYGGEATDVFFGLLNNTSPFSVDYHHGQPTLENDILAVTDRIAYDHFQKQLSFKGVMTAAEKTALDGATSATADFRTAVQALFDDSQKAFAAFFDRYPDLKGLYESFVASNTPFEDKMSALLADILPDLRAKLKRQQVRQTVSAQVGVDLTLVTPLLENASLLHAVGASADPAIADFLALETKGVSADIFFADDVAGVADQTDIVSAIDYREGRATLPPNPAGGNASVSGVWRGFLEAPDNGFYNFYIEADVGADVSLTLAGEARTLALNDGVWQNQDPIELQAGRLYELAFIAKKVKDVLVLKWERKGMGRAPIPAAQFYPGGPLERFTTLYLPLLKVLAIADALVLSSAELKHFASHADYFINGEGWLNALPAAPLPAGATAQALLRNMLALLQYRTLQEELKIRDEGLLELLQDPSASGEDGKLLLSRVTGWQEADRTALQDHFGLTTGDLSHLQHFVCLHDAFAVVKKLGIGAATLLNITTNEPTSDRLRNLQAALRARYDDSDWLNVMQPINDELRSRQRDALVAFVLHKLQQSEETRHIDTPDKLFEYFLIDVEMDPCMRTSRIKQAISSVQLFIQRCLLNLEPNVASSDIKAKQWEWMKRYRVWEANRKVFLFPENWLEPELRDDKSPFFKDLESELLQSDITDDAAATALVHYLEQLDEVAKLEICGMYYNENEIDNVADDIVHVIGRTSGGGRRYYYRRLEHSYWTPWEKVDVDIEDNPVLPVVWKGRLFLFWLSVLQQGSTDQKPPASGKIKEINLSNVQGDAKVNVNLILYWSEYYNGKWQPAKTSDINHPIHLGEFGPGGLESADTGSRSSTGSNSDGVNNDTGTPVPEIIVEGFKAAALIASDRTEKFDRTKLNLRSSEGSSGELYVYISYPGKNKTYFKLYNTHSLPVRLGDEVMPGSGGIGDVIFGIFSLSLRTRTFNQKNGAFIVNYCDRSEAEAENRQFSQEVLRHAVLYEIIQPRHRVNDIFEAPFFFQDRQHVFFVRPIESTVTVSGYRGFGFVVAPQELKEPIIPPLLVKPDLLEAVPKKIIYPSVAVATGVVDPRPVESFLHQTDFVKQAMGTGGTVRYGERIIGPGGSLGSKVYKKTNG